ncbi:MAG: recombinase family protein [Halobacteriales archaeon]|nr:recombinase family protein [Halobacteriales archaeon]
MSRVALYARNSKPPKGWKPQGEGEEPPGSWKLQLHALRAWAAREGHDVAMEEYDVVTGGNPNRPGWNKVLAAARGHHIHMVAAVKLDRVMRSTLHFHQVANELLDRGVDLLAVDQGVRISAKDPMSKLLRGILALFAELELDLARERSSAVLEVRNDGRLYGPRSAKPAGRPRLYAEGPKVRIRNGRPVHDRPRCAVCKMDAARLSGGGVPP